MEVNKIIQGDALEVLKTLPSESIDCAITSPPYFGLRDYGMEGQIGLEDTPEQFVAKLVDVFRECKRVLKKEGTLWLNLGDSYSGPMGNNRGEGGGGGQERGEKLFGKINRTKDRTSKRWGGGKNSVQGLNPKNLIGIPWRVAFALQADGWYLRQDIIWAKPNPMPESVTDRCTKSHEYIFLLTKSPKYFYDNEAIKEDSVTNEDRPFGVVRDREYNYDSKQAVLQKRDKCAGKGRIAYGGKRNGEEGTGQESFVSISEKRNKRSVWTITTKPFVEAHFATFPEDLIVPMIKAGCPKDGIVLDCFMGAGTSAVVALKLDRKYLGIELNPEYIKIAHDRIKPYENKLF